MPKVDRPTATKKGGCSIKMNGCYNTLDCSSIGHHTIAKCQNILIFLVDINCNLSLQSNKNELVDILLE